MISRAHLVSVVDQSVVIHVCYIFMNNYINQLLIVFLLITSNRFVNNAAFYMTRNHVNVLM
jgi:hypothetical protein